MGLNFIFLPFYTHHYLSLSRARFLRAETLNYILDHFEEENLRKMGIEVGEKLRSTLEVGYNFRVDEESRLKMIEHLNNFSGWGHFTIENEAIITKMPIFNKPHFIQGYLEGLFNLSLELVESYPNRMAFRMR